MEELLKEIKESLNIRQHGIKTKYWSRDGWKEVIEQPQRGKGTKAYTIRRIDMLQDKLKELKVDILNGKYDYKRREK